MFGKKVDEDFLKLQNLREGFKGFFLEREEEVDGLLIALLSRNHILLIGPVGSAKSMMTETLCNCIMGVRYFYRLLTKFIIDKDLFVSEVNVLEQETNEGKMIRFHNISRGMLPDSHLIFLDEIFKCSATTYSGQYVY